MQLMAHGNSKMEKVKGEKTGDGLWAIDDITHKSQITDYISRIYIHLNPRPLEPCFPITNHASFNPAEGRKSRNLLFAANFT